MDGELINARAPTSNLALENREVPLRNRTLCYKFPPLRHQTLKVQSVREDSSRATSHILFLGVLRQGRRSTRQTKKSSGGNDVERSVLNLSHLCFQGRLAIVDFAPMVPPAPSALQSKDCDCSVSWMVDPPRWCSRSARTSQGPGVHCTEDGPKSRPAKARTTQEHH